MKTLEKEKRLEGINRQIIRLIICVADEITIHSGVLTEETIYCIYLSRASNGAEDWATINK